MDGKRRACVQLPGVHAWLGLCLSHVRKCEHPWESAGEEIRLSLLSRHLPCPHCQWQTSSSVKSRNSWVFRELLDQASQKNGWSGPGRCQHQRAHTPGKSVLPRSPRMRQSPGKAVSYRVFSNHASVSAQFCSKCISSLCLLETICYLYIKTLEKEMATHSSTLAWKIPWTEEHGRLQSMGSQRVGHD